MSESGDGSKKAFAGDDTYDTSSSSRLHLHGLEDNLRASILKEIKNGKSAGRSTMVDDDSTARRECKLQYSLGTLSTVCGEVSADESPTGVDGAYRHTSSPAQQEEDPHASNSKRYSAANAAGDLTVVFILEDEYDMGDSEGGGHDQEGGGEEVLDLDENENGSVIQSQEDLEVYLGKINQQQGSDKKKRDKFIRNFFKVLKKLKEKEDKTDQ